MTRAAARARSGRLLRKLLGATLLPAALALGAFGYFAHYVARRALEDELGRRLGMAAAGTALTILPEQLAAIGSGDEDSRTYANLRARLEAARVGLGVRRVALVAADLTGRGDTDGRIALGAPAHELGADRPELARAATGAPSASPLFQGHDGRPYKRGYAAVGAPAAGFVMVEGSADFYEPLVRFRRWLIAWGAAVIGLMVALTVLVARRITTPLGELTASADRIGRGDLEAPVRVTSDDEVGVLAARLDDMREALRARDERLQMMLAGIAHEVRNPLGGLELYAGLLREGLEGQGERLGEVARIEREIGHLKRVVTEFLEYARRPRPELAEVPVGELLAEVAELGAAEGEGARIHVEAPATPLVAHADRHQLRRALLNLTRNARAAAGKSGQVVLAARSQQGRVRIEVRDSGPGVPAADRDKIFQAFYTTKEKGTGLGLAFVREIVRDHEGEVSVDQAPEGGARFSLTLPAV